MSERHGCRAATRQRLLIAAAEELTSVGWNGFSLLEVCRAAGLSTGALYYHFDGKADLIEAVAREHQHSVNEAADRAYSAAAAPIESMIRFSFAVVRLLTHDPFVRASAELSLAPRAPYAAEMWNEWIAILAHLAAAAVAAGEISSALNPDHLAEHIIAAIVGTWLTSAANDHEDFYIRIQEMWDILIASNVEPSHRASSRSFALAVCAQIATDFPVTSRPSADG